MTHRVRVITLNVLTLTDADGQRRQEVVRQGLRGLRPDIVALQEVTRGPDFDQVRHLLGPDFTVVDLPGRSPAGTGESLASRWPMGALATLDLPIAASLAEPAGATALAGNTCVSIKR